MNRSILLAAMLLIPATAPAQPMKVGVNVGGGTTYWDGLVFSDVMRQAPPFKGDGGWPWKGTPPLAEDGWPQYAPGQLNPPYSLVGTNTPFPAGTYTLTATGTGVLAVPHHANWLGHTNYTFAGPPTSYRMTWPTKPSTESFWVLMMQSEASDRLRDIHLTMPDARPDTPFRPQFLADLAGAKILRFMDAKAINSNKVVEWREEVAQAAMASNAWRTPAQWTYDDCVLLANTVGADPWFCIPHYASDDYVREMACAINCKLDKDRTIYVEYSNELWNWAFPNAKATETAYRKLENPGMSLFAYQGKLAADKMAVFKAALPPSRKVVRVVCGQAVYYAAAAETIGGAGAGNFDAIGCAPYFDNKLPAGVDRAATLKKLGETYAAGDKAAALDEVFRGLRASLEDTPKHAAEWRKMADKYKVPLLLYEGGQHLTPGEDPNLNQLYAEANRDPRMGLAYARYLTALELGGVEAAVLYSSHGHYSKSGYWGLNEWVGQGAAKQRSVEFMAK